MPISDDVRNFLDRMEPGLTDIEDQPGFEEAAQQVYDGVQEEVRSLDKGQGQVDLERLAFVLTMQSEAINKLVDELEELRPAIRFITSVLLGNTDQEVDNA